MKCYHGTSIEKWNLIQEDGQLWGYNIYKNPDGSEYRSYRYTYLSPEIKIAEEYGDVILEIDYEPVGVDGTETDNFCFDYDIPMDELKKGAYCWQFSVFIPISLDKVKRIK